MKKVENLLISANPFKALAVTVIFLLALGFHNRFILDDAFISFRYAENFAQGHGLIWNIGDTEPVEGYTNFLWTLLMVPAAALNVNPIFWSMFLGFIFGSGTLLFTYYVSLRITRSRFAALLSVVLLGTNYTYSSYITGGLETQLQTFLVIVSAYVSIVLLDRSSDAKPARILYPLLSILFSLAVLTRLDSILICIVLFLALSRSIYTSQECFNEKLIKVAMLIMPGVFIVGSWLLLKYFYYGDILPNTYYVKAAGKLSLLRGLFYTASFFFDYGLFPFLVLAAFYFRKVFLKFNFTIILVSSIFIWILYVIKVSGDFMEFRFFVPIMPFLYILVTISILFMPGWKERTTSVIFLLSLSFFHAVTFTGSRGIESIRQLNAHIVDENQDWQKVGCVLGDIFSGASPSVVISTTAAGAIPYYSKLPTIDMLGLNDKWIARSGVIIDDRPGHTCYATISYLTDSKVNLVIGHPQVKEKSSPPATDPRAFFWGNPEISQLPSTSKIIEIPLNSKYRLDVLYMTKNSAVDKVIGEFNLITHEIKF